MWSQRPAGGNSISERANKIIVSRIERPPAQQQPQADQQSPTVEQSPEQNGDRQSQEQR